jgi:hypothetical protein
MKAAAKLAANRASVARNLFGEDAAHTEKATNLIGEQHATSGGTSNKVDLNRSGRGNGERAVGEEAADLCRSVWMLQECPLL